MNLSKRIWFPRLVLSAALISGVYAAPTSRPGAAMNATEKAKKTAEVLVKQGADALALGDYKAARDCFVDVLQVDPRNRRSLEGLGYCYIKLDDMQRAMRSLEGALAIPEPPSRSLTMNLAASLVRTRNPMRGAKILRDYMAAHPDPVDEPMLNAFAICLGQASDEARINRLFEDCVKFYDAQNAKLEKTRPGMKRWGVEWIDQSEWAKKDAHNKTIQKQLDNKWRSVAGAQKEYNKAVTAYNNASAGRFRGGANLNGLQNDIKREKEKLDRLQGEYNEVASKMDRASLPKAFAGVELEDTTMAVASAPPSLGEKLAGADVRPPGVRPPAAPPQLSRQDAPGTPATVTPPAPPPATPPAVAVNPPPAPPATPAPAAPVLPTPPAAKPVRSIFVYAAGVAVAPNLVLTSASVAEGTTRISVQTGAGDQFDADVVQTDAKSGLSLIRLRNGRMGHLNLAPNFAGGTVQCACFPTPSVFDPEPAIVTGSAGAAKEDWQIRLARHPRLSGAALIAEGKIVGVVTAPRDADVAKLPAATLDQVRALLGNTPLPAAAANADPLAAAAMVTGVKGK